MCVSSSDSKQSSEEYEDGHVDDPILTHPKFDETETRIAIASHPVHAMLVAFPIAAAFGTAGSDLIYWWTGDDFWLRASMWATGSGFWLGVLAAVAGTVELLIVPGIHIRSESWTHFIIAMVLLSILGANWGLRLYDGNLVLPWGAMLSVTGAVMTGVTGWHGGKLVFDYQIGTMKPQVD
jgi:uncharacterized membrane protein